jgi:hypothetical protein
MADKPINIPIRVKGAGKAKQDLKGVEGGIKSMGKAALKVGAAFYAAKGLISGFTKIIDLSAEQELAEQKLSTALGRTSTSLLNQASALQQISTFGDEAIITQQAFLASLQFSEEQIKTIIPVAMDLAAATGMSLESAVRNTAKTFSGMSGELGELVPQLRGLTAEQMKAGEAVKLMSDLFEGQAEGQTQTLAGGIEQMKNAFGDAGEAIGRLFVKPTKWVVERLKSMAEWAGKVADQLARFLGIDAVAPAKQLADDIERGAKASKDLAESSEEITEEAKKAAEWTAQTAAGLMTSAVMGDNVEQALKRAVVQLAIMVAQAKLFEAIMEKAKLVAIFGSGGPLAAVANFLFGKSPTQAFPSAKAGANITINQTIQGGMVDHNFAANSIIPAINKAISTGQARIG